MATLKRVLAGFYIPTALEGTVWTQEKFVTEFKPSGRAYRKKKEVYQVFVFRGI